MKAMVLSNGELKVKDIEDTLEELQKIVGGYIEIPFLSEVFAENEIDVVINEEGKLIEGLTPEIAVIGKKTNSVLDIVYGNCVFVSHDEEGNTVALNDKQVAIVKDQLKMEVILHNNKEDKDIVLKALFI